MRPRITSVAFSYTAPNSVVSGPRFRQVVHDSVSTEKLDRFPTESWTTSNGILDRFPWNHWTTSTGIRTLNKTMVLELARCEFLTRRENVLLLGNRDPATFCTSLLHY